MQRVLGEQRHHAFERVEPRNVHLELGRARSGEDVRDEDERRQIMHLRRDSQLADGAERGAEDAEREEVARALGQRREAEARVQPPAGGDVHALDEGVDVRLANHRTMGP